MQIVQGWAYVLFFDARANTPCIVVVRVAQGQTSFTDYSQIAHISLTAQNRHFEYAFTAQRATDFNARLDFYPGIYHPDVYIDNVPLRRNR